MDTNTEVASIESDPRVYLRVQNALGSNLNASGREALKSWCDKIEHEFEGPDIHDPVEKDFRLLLGRIRRENEFIADVARLRPDGYLDSNAIEALVLLFDSNTRFCEKK